MMPPVGRGDRSHGSDPVAFAATVSGGGAMRAVDTWALAAILVLAAVYVFWDLHRPFNQTDEFLYGEVVRRMLETGDYLTPRFASIDLFTKPPLFYWLSLPILAGTGDLALAVRLLPGLSFLAILFIVFRIARDQWSPRTGIVAALAFFLCYDHLFNHVYKAGVMEGFLNLQVAIVFLLNLQLAERPGRIRWIGVMIGLALLTKSVFAVVPAGITALNLWLNRGTVRLSASYLVQTVVLFLAVVTPWFAAVLYEDGLRVLDYMVVDQVWSRALNDTAVAADTGRSFGRSETLYVLRHFIEYGQPWSTLVWPALWVAFRGATTGENRRSQVPFLAAVWFVGVMALFLVSRGRWSWYISSVYIPGSVLVASLLREFWRDPDTAIAPLVWVLVGCASFLSTAPFIFNTYEASSGASPLYGDALVQLLVLPPMLFAVASLWRREAGEADLARRGVHRAVASAALAWGAVGAVTAVAVISEPQLPLHPMVFAAGAVVCVSVLLLVPVRRSRVARAVAVMTPVIIGAAYLVAPLRWSGLDNQRGELVTVQQHLATRAGESLELSPVPLFSFIPIYATYGRDYDVSYDPATMTVSVEALPRGEEVSQPRSGEGR